MGKNNERELLPDVLRGFAIILVVLGHCIQEGSGGVYRSEQLYFSDRLYQFIYSFHMPLFMMVSGYLSWESLKKAGSREERKKLIIKKASTLLLPVFLWTALDYARILVMNFINDTPQPEALVFVYFYLAVTNLWYLWAVWWGFLIICIMHYCLKDSIIIYVFGFLLLFLIPDGLGLGSYKYMLPYFILAFYMHGYMDNNIDAFNIVKKPYIMVLTGICFAGLFYFYNEESFIYLTGYKLIGKDVFKQFITDIYRTAIGFFGGGFFIMLWQYIINKRNKTEELNLVLRILRIFGINSMGIYILSGYLVIFVVQQFSVTGEPSYLINLLEALPVLCLSLLITVILKRIPVLRKFVGK